MFGVGSGKDAGGEEMAFAATVFLLLTLLLIALLLFGTVFVQPLA